jgi:hypothetical protein
MKHSGNGKCRVGVVQKYRKERNAVTKTVSLTRFIEYINEEEKRRGAGDAIVKLAWQQNPRTVT